MSSDHEEELPGSAFDSTERAKARRFLSGIPSFCLALPIIAWGHRIPVAGSLRLPLDTLALALALVIVTAILQLSRPQGSDWTLRPSSLRRVVRLASVPEQATMITLFSCVVVSLTICTLSTVARFLAP
jgi:hypothetical protein